MAETDTRQPTERHTDEARSSKGSAKLTSTEARQGEIVLGRFGRAVWIAAFVLLILGIATSVGGEHAKL